MKFRVTWNGLRGETTVRVVSEEEVQELCHSLIVNRYVFFVVPLPICH